jgi:hypothetical protein
MQSTDNTITLLSKLNNIKNSGCGWKMFCKYQVSSEEITKPYKENRYVFCGNRVVRIFDDEPLNVYNAICVPLGGDKRG